jgi:hypothetical protein
MGASPVTGSLEALLAENDALRRQVRMLQQQLELRAQASRRSEESDAAETSARRRVTTGMSRGITADQVERWGQRMAMHPHWRSLRIGPPGGLRELIEQQRRHWWKPSLELEQELDRRCPGLGTELAEALRGPHSRVRWAVRAAFAVYGQRAPEWLSADPQRVVTELLQRLERLEQRGRARQGREQRRGTRTENHTRSREQRSGCQPSGSPAADPRHAALAELGLEPGASPQAIRRAYRELAKAHHPDLGGDVAAFHRLDAAYRLLLGSP